MSFDPPRPAVEQVVRVALAEDFGVAGDITSIACVPADAVASAELVARADGVLAGTAAAAECMRQVDATLALDWFRSDGAAVGPGTPIGRVSGSLRSILAAERTALNLLTHCSGVASLTRRYVDAVRESGSRTVVRDTRKTTPGLRALEKAAVRAGGGANHRDSLSDAVLIKDNHLRATSIAEAVRAARRGWPGRVVEVECDTLAQVTEAIAVEPDLVLLDNMDPADVASAVELGAGRVSFEVSGGVTLDTVAAYAATNVDYIAVGALTHSAPALDIGLDLIAGHEE